MQEQPGDTALDFGVDASGWRWRTHASDIVVPGAKEHRLRPALRWGHAAVDGVWISVASMPKSAMWRPQLCLSPAWTAMAANRRRSGIDLDDVPTMCMSNWR